MKAPESATAPGEPGEAAAVGDSVARNTGFALATKLASAVFTAVLTLVLVRILGPEEYGVFALALGVGGLVLVPSDLGISHSAARFIAEVRKDRDAVARVLADALRLKLAVSGAFAVAMIALAGPIAAVYDTPELAWPIRVLAVAVVGQSLLLMYGGVLEAVGRVSVYLRMVTVESAVETATAITLVVLGMGATGAVLGRAAGYALAAGLGVATLARALGRRLPSLRGRSHGHLGRITRYGSALLIVDGAFTLFSQIDVLLIGAILTVRQVALFQAPTKLIAFLGYVGLAARSGVAPRLARGSESPDSSALADALRYLILLQMLFVAPVLVWAEPLTRLALGGEYAASADVLRALAPYMFLMAVSPLLAGSVNYLGEARRRIPIAIGAVLLNLAIDLALLSRVGILAAALATNVAYAFYVAAHLRICRQLLGLEVLPLLATVLRGLAAAGAMALVLLAFGTSDVSVPALLAGGLLGTVIYVGILLAVRALTQSEMRLAWARLREALPRPAR